MQVVGTQNFGLCQHSLSNLDPTRRAPSQHLPTRRRLYPRLRIRDWPRGEYESGTKTIQSCRLTCRRFCEVSSGLLVRLVRVSYRLSSVSRLKDISHHPIISRGVRAIQIDLGIHKTEFAPSFESFMMTQEHILRMRIPLLSIPHKQATAEAVAAFWHRIRNAQKNASLDGIHEAHLQKLYREYIEHCEDQKMMRERGNFAQIVGSAFARMPFARELRFEDAMLDHWNYKILSISSGDIQGEIYKRSAGL